MFLDFTAPIEILEVHDTPVFNVVRSSVRPRGSEASEKGKSSDLSSGTLKSSKDPAVSSETASFESPYNWSSLGSFVCRLYISVNVRQSCGVNYFGLPRLLSTLIILSLSPWWASFGRLTLDSFQGFHHLLKSNVLSRHIRVSFCSLYWFLNCGSKEVEVD